jgi:hypothetical protein
VVVDMLDENMLRQKVSPTYNLQVLYPSVAQRWHPTRNNGLLPSKVAPRTTRKAWWLCPIVSPCGCIHEYEQSIVNKVNGTNCPYCSTAGGKKICYHQSLAFLYPEISQQWHGGKNIDPTPDKVPPHSNKLVWWLCPNTCPYGCRHEYQQIINDKVSGKGSPYCCIGGAKQICFHQSLAFLHPEISQQWHKEKNGDLTPSQVTPGSNKIVWWLCPQTCPYGCIHEYQQIIQDKVKGIGCPYCSTSGSTKICYHQSLSFLYPEISKQWHKGKMVI